MTQDIRDNQPTFPGLKPVDELVPVAAKQPSRIKSRLIESSVHIAEDDSTSILYQHTVFCQTGMPYRDPGAGVRIWQRSQGAAHLEVEAGRAFHRKRHVR